MCRSVVMATVKWVWCFTQTIRSKELFLQTCQLTRILRETHAFGQSLTLTRKHEDVSRISKQRRCVLIFNPVSTNLVATCYFEKIRKAT